MSDIKDHEVGRGGQAGAIRLFRDEGDGTFSVAVTSNLRVWDTSSLAWVKAVGPSGVLSISGSSSGAAASGSTSVTQSTTPWVVGGNVGASLVGTSAVSIQGTVTTQTSLSGVPLVSISGTVATQTSLSGVPLVSISGTVATQTSLSGVPLVSVSGTLTVGSHAVTQGTSPWIISGGGVSLTGTSLVSVSGTVTSVPSGTQNVSQAGSFSVTQGTSPWLTSLAGTNLVSQAGSFSVTQGTSPWIIGGGGVSITGTALVSLSGTNLVSQSGSFSVTQGTSPWLTSLSGTNLVSVAGSVVQHQDVSRSSVTLYADAIAALAAEGTASLTGTRAGLSVAASPTYVVTAGKTLRVTNVGIAVKTTVATVCNSRWRVRIGGAGITAGQPPVLLLETSTPAAAVSSTGVDDAALPDGMEFAAGTSLSFSHVESHSSATSSLCLVGFEY